MAQEPQPTHPQLEMLAKDTNSGGGGCPAVYRRNDGMAVVQAQAVDGATFGQLENVLPGEQAVYIDPDVLLRAADEWRARRPG